MSKENVELMKRLYELLDEAGLEAVIEFTHSDVEIVPPAEWLEGSTIRGREMVREFARQWMTAFEGFKVEPERFVDAAGGRVVVYVRDSGRIPGSNTGIDARVIHVWTLAGGKIMRWQVFTDENQALEAAGLSRSALDEEQ
jgi:uncharacterized protein